MTQAHRPPRRVLLMAFSQGLLGRVLLCTFVLSALMEILSLLEQTTLILGRHLGLKGVLTYAILHFPAIVLQAIPLSVMMGALFLLMQMTLNSEVASLRAAGLSTVRLYLLMLPATLVVGMIAMALHEFAAPQAELQLARWWSQTDRHPQDDTRAFWFHSRTDIVHVGAFGRGGRDLYSLALFQRNADGLLIGTATAETANYEKGEWHVHNMRWLSPQPNKVVVKVTGDHTIGQAGVTPDDILVMSQSYPILSTRKINAILHHGAAASLPKAAYRMALFLPYIIPLNLCVMLLLALPVVYIPPRTGTRSLMPVAALGAGFGFIVLQGLIQALGNAGTLPAVPAIVAAPIMAIMFGIAWLLKMEER
ncbi:LptF/LptG family permease [Brytella acorum]|uniref:LptF/LptG family permease n=1 Tax=Brytella acorum TaxID=2959299 RepID=A0AA35UKN4_9PROT|nr:LptF/LptG family permease [Brytella acorum]MDF3623958.1 LptF/LptG family permease [Brytella acorum]CAI9122202.1 LptF/LptG family permease [Brytella acorum]